MYVLNCIIPTYNVLAFKIIKKICEPIVEYLVGKRSINAEERLHSQNAPVLNV